MRREGQEEEWKTGVCSSNSCLLLSKSKLFFAQDSLYDQRLLLIFATHLNIPNSLNMLGPCKNEKEP